MNRRYLESLLAPVIMSSHKKKIKQVICRYKAAAIPLFYVLSISIRYICRNVSNRNNDMIHRRKYPKPQMKRLVQTSESPGTEREAPV